MFLSVCVYIYIYTDIYTGFPGGSDDKESACNAGDLDSRLGRSPGEGNGYPLHCSCLDNSMDRGAWWAAVHYWETNTFTCTHTHTGCTAYCWNVYVCMYFIYKGIIYMSPFHFKVLTLPFDTQIRHVYFFSYIMGKKQHITETNTPSLSKKGKQSKKLFGITEIINIFC